MFHLKAQLIWAWFKGSAYSFVVSAEKDVAELEIKAGDEVKIRFFDRGNTKNNFKDIVTHRNLDILLPNKYCIICDSNNQKLKQFSAVEIKCVY